jgi:hypothetical protein
MSTPGKVSILYRSVTTGTAALESFRLNLFSRFEGRRRERATLASASAVSSRLLLTGRQRAKCEITN